MRTLLISVVIAIVAFASLFGSTRHVTERWRRSQQGIAPGVTVLNMRMGGMLPAEAKKLLEEKAPEIKVSSQNARYDSEKGEVIPHVNGKVLDIDATLQALVEAPSGTQVAPVWRVVPAEVRESHFYPVRSGSRDCGLVAFQVNVDWGNQVLPDMLAVLKEHDVKITFYPTGRWAERFPELAAQIAASSHEIGNHGMQHDHPTQLGQDEFKQHIKQAERAIKEATGRIARLYAPPYGEFDAETVRLAAELGYHTVLWSLDTADWRDPSADQIVSRLAPRLQSGDLVLMHPKPQTVAALPRLIKAAAEKGLQVTTVGHLLRESGL